MRIEYWGIGVENKKMKGKKSRHTKSKKFLKRRVRIWEDHAWNMIWDNSKGQEKRCRKKNMSKINIKKIEYVQSMRGAWEKAKREYEIRSKD